MTDTPPFDSKLDSSLDHALAAKPRLTIPEDFATRVARHVPDQRPVRTSQPRAISAAAAVGVVLLLLFVLALPWLTLSRTALLSGQAVLSAELLLFALGWWRLSDV